ncbi:hypothetical protein PFISCL1PPCAC_6140, partial [Pristionchus fissidentatus]
MNYRINRINLELSLEVSLLYVVECLGGRVDEALVEIAGVKEVELGGRNEISSQQILRKGPKGGERHKATTVTDNNTLLLEGEERRLELRLTEVGARGESFDVIRRGGVRDTLNGATENGAGRVGEMGSSSSRGGEGGIEGNDELSEASVENECLQLHTTGLEPSPYEITRDEGSIGLSEVGCELGNGRDAISLRLFSQRLELFRREVVALVLENVVCSAVYREEEDDVAKQTGKEETHS